MAEPLTVRVFARIGTNADDTYCGGHSSAVGLRLYYGSTTRPSRVVNTESLYLRTIGGQEVLEPTAPTATTAKYKDSPALRFTGGNVWMEIGTGWSE